MAKRSAAEMRELYAGSRKKTNGVAHPVKATEQQAQAQDDPYINVSGTIPKEIDSATAKIYGDEPVKKDYTKGSFTKEQPASPIVTESTPEPTGYDIPPAPEDSSFSGKLPVDKATGQVKQPTRTAPSARPNAIPPHPASDFRNKGMDDMPNRQRAKSSALLAKMGLKFYKWLNEKGKDWIKFTEDDAMKKSIDGSFDMDILEMQIQTPNGGWCSIKDFINDMNLGIDEACSIKPEWEQEVETTSTEVLQEMGWGMTPKQHLGELFLEDLVPKVMELVQIKATQNYIFKVCAEQLALQKAQAGQAMGAHLTPPRPQATHIPASPTPKTPTPQAQKQAPEPQAQPDVNDQIRQNIEEKIEKGADAITQEAEIIQPSLNTSEQVAQEKITRKKSPGRPPKKKEQAPEIRESGELFEKE